MKRQEKGRGKLDIRVLFTLAAIAEILGTLLIATLLTALLENLLHEAIEVHPLVWLLLFGTTIGLTAATVVNVLLLRPVVRLSRAMKQVASGNFAVRLTTNSVINEIADSYDSFNRMVEALGETETLQTDFVSNVSHEIKTPVSAIEGYTTLLQSTDVSPEQAGYIERILLNTRRLSTLVGNILLLSKVSNHTMPMKQTCYRLDEQIRQAIVLLEAQWSPKQLDFDADLAEVTWRGPETLMLHVWTNLLSNAVKFSPQHGLIAVALKQTDGRFEIAITDQGPGIPPEEQERIYRRFYQVDSSHQQEGNGLGLALCKQILDDCGGTIREENQSPCGCRKQNRRKLMAQENNTAREQTELEKLSQDALNQARRERKMIQDTCIAELAQCDTEIPEALEKQVQAEIASLQQAKENLSSAHKIASSTVDELSARAADVAKSLNRKWYRINPPSNTAIDVQEEEKSFFARGMNGYKIALIVFIGSFAGVMLELLWCFARHGYLESRSGLVWGPFNMLYGVGAASLSIILYRFRNRGKWLSFLGGFVVGSVVEYVCSWLQEVLFGSRSWDYSRVPFNINGRICLLYSLFWGALGIFWIKDIYPFMAKWILKLPNRAGKILTWVLSIFLAVNCLVSAAAVYRWSERLHDEPPKTWIGSVMDARFPNERMERIYANMNFGDSE